MGGYYADGPGAQNRGARSSQQDCRKADDSNLQATRGLAEGRFRVRKGPVCPVAVPWKGVKSRGGKSVIDLITDALGGPWKTNALRHSFGTYRVLQLDAVGKVALEMGNSERMVKSHYYDAGRKKAEAKRWFELGPDKVSRKLEVVA